MPYEYKEGRYVHEFPTWDKEADLSSIERNLITYAQSRSGKGATQIIPFLLKSSNINALVVDPKGEAAEETAEIREEIFGQKVHILDPFHTTSFPKKRLATYNPLDHIDPTTNEAFRQINALADGLLTRHSVEAGHWDNGAKKVIAGFIAHVLTHPDYEGRRSLPTVRKLLTETGDAFADILNKMVENTACGGLPKTGANKLMNTGTESGHFISGATTNTEWLDDPDIAEFLSSSSFKLSDIKTTNCDVFLVLPFEALEEYDRFLRLFVRLAIYHMQKKLPNGELKGRNTFFILDEFYSLGHLEPIAKSIGGMPGLNLHLWPFLQDYPQMLKLYGKEGAGTFMANCEAKFFYGVNDPDTAEYVSNGAGRLQEHELKVKPPIKPKFRVPQPAGFWDIFWGRETEEQKRFRIMLDPPNPSNKWEIKTHTVEDSARAREEYETMKHAKEAKYQDEMNKYAHARSCIGHPRVTPDEVMQITKKNPKRGVSDFALVLDGGVCWKAPLKPYFEGL